MYIKIIIVNALEIPSNASEGLLSFLKTVHRQKSSRLFKFSINNHRHYKLNADVYFAIHEVDPVFENGM